MQVQQRTDRELMLQEIRSQTYAEMNHSYLTGILRSPDLELLQLVLSEAMATAAGLSNGEVETVVSTLLLIYHGLAVHDQIENLAERSDERFRQLGVLAGDYFSSKYYRLLAEAGQVALIGQFARAIQAINEAKAELERDPADFGVSVERYLNMQETIQGSLLHRLRVTHLANQTLWEEVVTLLVRATVLSREQEQGQVPVWKRTFANLLVWQKASGEERKWLKQLPLGKGPENRLLSLYVKYGTSSLISQKIEDCLSLAAHKLKRMPEYLGVLQGLFERLTEFQPVQRRAGEEV